MTDTPIVAARRARLKAWIDDKFGGVLASFIAQTKINQGELSALLKDKSFGEKKAAKLEKQARMPPGYLVQPLTDAQPSTPTQIFTSERRANDNLLALQIGLESLLVAVLQRTPGSAGVFLEDAEGVAKREKFSLERGTLGSLVDIARGVHSEEEAAARVRRRGGSAARTKRGSQGQDKEP